MKESEFGKMMFSSTESENDDSEDESLNEENNKDEIKQVKEK